ncbi:MAG TPA: hypothetical protein VMU39_09620 [Solirubrobacteraceae bacterium]|nr:hypothetical protein [Solirubrobacteraceae bacterium]
MVPSRSSSSAATRRLATGTSLPNCLKTYLPTPNAWCRMIFEVLRDPATGARVLSFLAFGVAHPE